MKWLLWPGLNWVSREKAKLVHLLPKDSPAQPVQSLDVGCGNAFFTWHAATRGSSCVGLTLHEWERRHCEEMGAYLRVPPENMRFHRSRLEEFAADSRHREAFDQALMLDVIEHIRDDRAALKQDHSLLNDNGSVFITVPNWDYERDGRSPHVSREENGWHVRHGYIFERLESLLERCGFEPIDRRRYGTRGTTLATQFQRAVLRQNLPLSVLCFPVLRFVVFLLSFWKQPHTLLVIGRKR